MISVKSIIFPDLYADLRKVLKDHGALQFLRRKLKPSDDSTTEVISYYEKFESIVIRACYDALEYKTIYPNHVDSYANQRRRDREILADIDVQVNALNRLIKFLSAYPEYSWLLVNSCLSHSPLCFKKDEDGGCNADKFIEVLTVLRTAIEQDLPLIKRSTFSHHHLVGALDYQKAIGVSQGRTIDSAINGLLFHLTLLFRCYTANRMDEIGFVKMPTFGKPNYAISTELIAATLDVDVPSPHGLCARLHKLLTNNPEIRFVHWPTYLPEELDLIKQSTKNKN